MRNYLNRRRIARLAKQLGYSGTTRNYALTTHATYDWRDVR